jgi:hypothetical protein
LGLWAKYVAKSLRHVNFGPKIFEVCNLKTSNNLGDFSILTTEFTGFGFFGKRSENTYYYLVCHSTEKVITKIAASNETRLYPHINPENTFLMVWEKSK